MTKFYAEGNKGGSYVAIEMTRQDDVVHLEVGHNCVKFIDQDINVFFLAEILTRAKDFGFDKIEKDVFEDGTPEWAKPI